MQVVYNAKAQEAGIYVLEACGVDSIPAEMGLLHAKQQFDGIIMSDVAEYVMKPFQNALCTSHAAHVVTSSTAGELRKISIGVYGPD